MNNATFEEIGQTRGSSVAAIQFSFTEEPGKLSFTISLLPMRLDPVPLSTLSLFSCASAFSSNLICWRPKEMYRRAENFQRPDLICETPASDPASPPSTRFPCSSERSSSQKRR